MDTLKLADSAKRYYEKTKAKSVYHGWEKFVLTNGIECIFVNADYEPSDGEAVFYLRTQNGNTVCELKK